MMMKAVSRDLVQKLWQRQEGKHFTSGAETKLRVQKCFPKGLTCSCRMVHLCLEFMQSCLKNDETVQNGEEIVLSIYF
jgi:hypothetical protein